MDKRKREDSSVPASQKKRRRTSVKDGRQRHKTVTSGSEKVLSKHQSIISPPTTGQDGSAILEPPPGLSRLGRKRWRRRQKEKSSSGFDTGRFSTMTHAPNETFQHRSPNKSSTTVDINSVARRFAVTQLLSPPPPKRWNEKVDVPNSTIPNASSAVEGKQQDVDVVTPDVATKRLVQSSTRKEPSSEHSSIEPTEVDSDSSESSFTSESDHDESTSSSEESEVDQQELLHPSNNARPPAKRPLQHVTGPSLPAFEGRHTVLSQAQHVPRNDPAPFISTPLSATRTFLGGSSLGKKATSVPLHSNVTDTEASFRRFSAFLHGGDSESSGDDSSESESDDELLSSKRKPDRQAELSTANDQKENSKASAGVPDRPTSDVEVEDESQSDEESDAEEDDDEELELAPAASKPAPTWPANVGIKRQLSYSRGEPVQTPPSSSLIPEAVRSWSGGLSAVLNDNVLDDSDEDFDALRAMDDVSNSVFASTRPLPAGKLSVSPDRDLENVAREDVLLTVASSDRRVTRSMLSPKANPKRKDSERAMPAPGAAAAATIVCNTVRVDDVTRRRGKREAERQIFDENVSVDQRENVDIEKNKESRSSSSDLSELSRSPSPPASSPRVRNPRISNKEKLDPEGKDTDIAAVPEETHPMSKKRRMTGRKSKHFSPEKRSTRTTPRAEQTTSNKPMDESISMLSTTEAPVESIETPDRVPTPSAPTTRSATKKRKTTGKKSTYFTPPKPPVDTSLLDRVDLYNTSGKKKRVPAGVSIAPVPPSSSAHFGIIQEKLWREPFWLLIAVTFLNKTTGRAAVPIFWQLKEKYVSPEYFAEADEEELMVIIWRLGLQRQRARRCIALASAWVEREPVVGTRYRTLHYPRREDGKDFKRNQVVEEDADECEGALEIAHLPGCGPYAWDSWRIFCRDVLRGKATDYDGKDAGDEEFVPEWKKVLPLDKELRACLRWMWLREGWIWDCETGEKRAASDDEMQRARKGEMEVQDEAERKFAAQAAGVEIDTPRKAGADLEQGSAVVKAEAEVRTPQPEEKDDDMSDNIVVSPVPTRKSARLSTGKQ